MKFLKSPFKLAQEDCNCREKRIQYVRINSTFAESLVLGKAGRYWAQLFYETRLQDKKWFNTYGWKIVDLINDVGVKADFYQNTAIQYESEKETNFILAIEDGTTILTGIVLDYYFNDKCGVIYYMDERLLEKEFSVFTELLKLSVCVCSVDGEYLSSLSQNLYEGTEGLAMLYLERGILVSDNEYLLRELGFTQIPFEMNYPVNDALSRVLLFRKGRTVSEGGLRLITRVCSLEMLLGAELPSSYKSVENSEAQKFDAKECLHCHLTGLEVERMLGCFEQGMLLSCDTKARDTYVYTLSQYGKTGHSSM